MERRHKIYLGTFTTAVVIFMFISAGLIYLLYAKQQYQYIQLNNQIQQNQAETQNKLNELTEIVSDTRSQISSLDESVKIELNEIKASASADFSGIIEDVLKAVITIRTDVSQGTGFLITSEGHVVTNAHVLVGAREVYGINSQQEIISLNFIGYNSLYDLALLKMEDSTNYLELGDSNEIQVGEKVIAIGNPLGLQFSVSEGIVSAIDREGSNGINAYIQTDAALNPGNSGGPLINKEGKAIGINNFKVGGGESLGFALEADYIEDIVNEITLKELNQTII